MRPPDVLRLLDEDFDVEVFFPADPVREAEPVDRDLLAADARDLLPADDRDLPVEDEEVFFADVLLDDFDPPEVFLAPPVLLLDEDFAPPDARFAVERPPVEPDLAPPVLFPRAAEPEAFFAVDLAPPDDFFFEELAAPDVFRPAVLLVPDDLFAVELLLAAGFFAVDFFAVDFDLDAALFPDELFEAVFFVVAMCDPPVIKRILKNVTTRV